MHLYLWLPSPDRSCLLTWPARLVPLPKFLMKSANLASRPCAIITVLCALCGPVQATHLFISEFLASGNETYPDEDGDTSDWIEIRNPTAGHLLWIPGAPEPPRDFATLMGDPGFGRLLK